MESYSIILRYSLEDSFENKLMKTLLLHQAVTGACAVRLQDAVDAAEYTR